MTYAADVAPPFYHGTRADLAPGDLIAPGYSSNYGRRKLASWVYLTGTLDAAIWGAELAVGDGPGRIYIVEPTGAMEDYPNLTDKKRSAQPCRGHGEHCSPGNPTVSYRSREPLRVTGEVTDWQGHSPERLEAIKDHLERLKAQGIEATNCFPAPPKTGRACRQRAGLMALRLGASLGGMTLSASPRPAPHSAAPAPAPSRAPVPGRTCGSCTLCCKTVAVVELAKPAGAWCPHCRRSKGCTIYESRPAGCRDFHCEWMRSEKLGPEWRPDRAKFALMVTATGHLAACVDPVFPSGWRRPRYYQALRRWAQERAEDPSSSWPGVDVWIGRRCILILPDGEKDLGIVAADEEVRIERTMTAAGPVYAAEKFRVPDIAALRSMRPYQPSDSFLGQGQVALADKRR